MVKQGDTIQHLTFLQNGTKKTYTFPSERGVLLFSFPKSFTKVCTKEACLINQDLHWLKQNGFDVVGVSNESEKTQNKFKHQYDLEYPIFGYASPLKNEIGLKPFPILGILPRISWLIDKNGTILEMTKNFFSAEAHLKAAKDRIETSRESM